MEKRREQDEKRIMSLQEIILIVVRRRSLFLSLFLLFILGILFLNFWVWRSKKSITVVRRIEIGYYHRLESTGRMGPKKFFEDAGSLVSILDHLANSYKIEYQIDQFRVLARSGSMVQLFVSNGKSLETIESFIKKITQDTFGKHEKMYSDALDFINTTEKTIQINIANLKDTLKLMKTNSDRQKVTDFFRVYLLRNEETNLLDTLNKLEQKLGDIQRARHLEYLAKTQFSPESVQEHYYSFSKKVFNSFIGSVFAFLLAALLTLFINYLLIISQTLISSTSTARV